MMPEKKKKFEYQTLKEATTSSSRRKREKGDAKLCFLEGREQDSVTG